MADEARVVDVEVGAKEVEERAEEGGEGRRCVQCKSTNVVEENHEGQDLLVGEL